MGAIVDGVDVVRFKQDGTEEQRVRVPVTYSPKEKFIRRITEDPELNRQPAITLPKIGYEMTGMMYDPARKISNKLYFTFTGDNGAQRVFTPVPYEMTFNVYVQTKTQGEMFQIIEQIVPFFQPDYVVNMRGIQNPDIKWDVPITLDAIQTSDTYDGDIEERRMIITTFEFVMKGYLFGPVRDANLIRKVDLYYGNMDQLDKPEGEREFYEHVHIEAFLDGVPLNEIKKDDPYSIEVTYE
jgi:hypothetical protein